MPSTHSATATVVGPSGTLADFPLLLDISEARIGAAWWDAADSADPTTMRAAVDGVEVAIDPDPDGSFSLVGRTGLVVVRVPSWAAATTVDVTLYPPVAANGVRAASDPLGQYAAYPAPLAMYLPLGADAQDRTANGHHGTVNGATPSAAGLLGGSYLFDGVNDSIALPSVSGMLGDLSLLTAIGVFKPDRAGTTQEVLWASTDVNGFGDANTVFEFNQGRSAGNAEFSGGNADIHAVVYSATTAWTHLAAVVSGTGTAAIEAFVDGVSQGTSARPTISLPGNHFVGRPAQSVRYFAGHAQHLQLYSTPRTAAWISQHREMLANQAAMVGVWTQNPVATGRRRAMVIS